eukprot:IDg4730t1
MYIESASMSPAQNVAPPLVSLLNVSVCSTHFRKCSQSATVDLLYQKDLVKTELSVRPDTKNSHVGQTCQMAKSQNQCANIVLHRTENVQMK